MKLMKIYIIPWIHHHVLKYSCFVCFAIEGSGLFSLKMKLFKVLLWTNRKSKFIVVWIRPFGGNRGGGSLSDFGFAASLIDCMKEIMMFLDEWQHQDSICCPCLMKGALSSTKIKSRWFDMRIFLPGRYYWAFPLTKWDVFHTVTFLEAGSFLEGEFCSWR